MLVFDIETNGLYDNVSKLYCMSIYDSDNDKMYSFNPDTVSDGVDMLIDALDRGISICGHNVINYDIPVLEKLTDFKCPRDKRGLVIDTLVLSRLIYTHIEDWDRSLLKSGKLPSKLFKRQSLMAWGYRLGELKGTYGQSEDAWDRYTPEMLKYNAQDVRVTYKLYEKLTSYPYSPKAIKLEHEVAWLMSKQEKNGFPFDIDKAQKLEAVLRCRSGEIQAQLLQVVPQIPDKIFVPKRDNKAKGYKKGVPIQRYKAFNTNSRQQIEWLIRKYFKYSPSNPDCYAIKEDVEGIADFSEYRLKVDETSIDYMEHDAAASDELKKVLSLLQESLLLNKRLGQLADGNNAWLSMVGADKRMHGSVIPNGAISGRATHNHPNVAQVPHIGSPYGKECRELFNSGDWYQVGVDACGLELRCLAHFMAKWDGGAYAHEILTGDIHTKNQQAAGLPTRDQAKTFIYAYLYGAGDAKIGKIINGTASDGKAIKKKFNTALPAIAELRQSVEDTLVYPIDWRKRDRNGKVQVKWKRHFLYGLDRRKLHVRSVHSALNLLLQSAGALVCKKWIVITEERLIQLGLKHGWDGDFCLMAWIHDEQQIACRTKEIADIVVREAKQAMRDTQEYFKFNIQLDADGIIGKNWAECH